MRKMGLVTLVVMFSQQGCLSQLKTRSDVQGGSSAPAANVKKDRPADTVDSVVVESSNTPKFQSEEKDEQMRSLNGRVEEAENKVQELSQSLSQLDESRKAERQQYESKLALYEEAIKKMEGEIEALKAAKVAEEKPAPVKEKESGGKDSNASLREDFYRGEDSFKRKKWKDAIVSFQKYRETYPNGKFYPDATYKMGLCFVELGLKDESKSFFEEVRSKFPKSPLAKKASQKLKSL